MALLLKNFKIKKYNVITILLLLLLFIPGENSMGLYEKLLCYVYLGEPFGKETCVFFAF